MIAPAALAVVERGHRLASSVSDGLPARTRKSWLPYVSRLYAEAVRIVAPVSSRKLGRRVDPQLPRSTLG